MISSCWTGSYQFWWKETAGLVRCQKNKTIYLGAEKSYILNERGVGGRKHPQYVHLSQKGTSRAAISRQQKKSESKQQKSPRFFPPYGTLVTTSKHHLFFGENIYLFRSTTEYLLLGRGTTVPSPTLNFPPHLVSGTSAKATKSHGKFCLKHLQCGTCWTC